MNKIIHVVFAYSPGRFWGGVDKVVHELAQAQSLMGHHVEIWPASFGEDFYQGKVLVRYMGRRSIFGNVFSPLLAQAIASEKSPAIFHSHNTFHFLNYQVGRFSRKYLHKSFYHTHGALDPGLFRGFSFTELKKRAYNLLVEVPNLNKASGIFALSSYEAKQLGQLKIKAPIFIVPNGISLPSVKVMPRPSPVALGRSAVRLLYVGRINPKKQIELAISSLANLPESFSLSIAGDPKESPSYSSFLRGRIEELRIGHRVTWLGYVNELTKPAIYESHDIFLHSSKSEGMAMAILEAMSYGMPSVVTPGCYMSDAAKEGALIEAEALVDSISRAISSICASPALYERLSATALRYIDANHDWRAIAKDICAKYSV